MITSCPVGGSWEAVKTLLPEGPVSGGDPALGKLKEGKNMNTWPGGRRHAMEQTEHERWNASHYPGTRQLCSRCGEATGRCEDDTIWSKNDEPLCLICFEIEENEMVRDVDK